MARARGASLRVDTASLRVGTSRLKVSCIAWNGTNMGMKMCGMIGKSRPAYLLLVVVVV